VRLGGEVTPFRYQVAESHDDGLRLGQRVAHTKFGEGVILNTEGQGPHTRVQVNFEREGVKWLVASYAGLRSVP
jgi:DNA helicase-2/ATP-dependent DNA helicase PcrA